MCNFNSVVVLFVCLVLVFVVGIGCEAESVQESSPAQPEPSSAAPEQTKPQVKEKPVMADEVTATNEKANPRVVLETTKGNIVIELDAEKAPVTVANFLKYVEEGFYNGLIFHRVISGFMIQGGGLTTDMQEKTSHAPIKNEASNGLTNDRGTICMARKPDPDSATCQFFINVKDNHQLNYGGPAKPGYAVFGKVVEGMDVADAIVSVKTTRLGRLDDVPVEPVVIKSVRLVIAN